MKRVDSTNAARAADFCSPHSLTHSDLFFEHRQEDWTIVLVDVLAWIWRTACRRPWRAAGLHRTSNQASQNATVTKLVSTTFAPLICCLTVVYNGSSVL